jgi:hypothetical protein
MTYQLWWFSVRVKLTNRKHRRAVHSFVVPGDCAHYLLQGITLFSDFPLLIAIKLAGRAITNAPVLVDPGPPAERERGPHGVPFWPEIECAPGSTIDVELSLPTGLYIGRASRYPVLQLNGKKGYE